MCVCVCVCVCMYEYLYILCIRPNLSIILPMGHLIVFSKKYLMRCEDEIQVHVHVQIRTNHLQNMERGRKWRRSRKDIEVKVKM